MERIRTRFAPSPTGELHLGNARTALYAALLAAHGALVLRIEDTDAARSQRQYEEALLADLDWLGVNWDEGPDRGGPYAPYRQSQRLDLYAEFYARLEAAGWAYPCFCTESELARQRARQLAAGLPPRYSGNCARLSSAQIAERQTRIAPTLRLRVPPESVWEFIDLVQGPQTFRSEDLGDFIIRRADGTPSFLFSNAVDDALMEITHVLRGADHISNTPRQQIVQKYLGLPIPQYGHLALIVGNDGKPLSKRAGSRSLRELREAGYLPEAVVNHLARLGHFYRENTLLTFAQLATEFNLSQLGRAPARHDESALLHWQKEAVMTASEQRLWDWLGTKIDHQIPDRELFISTVRPNLLFPRDANQWLQIIYQPDLEFTPEARNAIINAGSEFYRHAGELLLTHGTDFSEFSRELKKSTGKRGPELFHPLRAALTGTLVGPELARLWKIIPVDQIRRRITELRID